MSIGKKSMIQVNKLVQTFVIVVAIFHSNGGLTQSNIKRDKERMDSCEAKIEQYWCGGQKLTYPKLYHKRKLEIDKAILNFAGAKFFDDPDSTSIEQQLEKLKKFVVTSHESRNGLITLKREVLKGGYLKVEANFEYLKGILYREKLLIYTVSNGSCTLHGYFFDYSLFRRYLMEYINFDFEMIDCSHMKIEKSKLENIAKASIDRGEYRITVNDPRGDEWVNSILVNQFNADSSCCYLLNKPAPFIIELVKKDRLDIIEDLLFSPNYFYSIQAMEALVFLSKSRNLSLDSKVIEKVKEVRCSSDLITVKQHPDVEVTYHGYKDIGLSDLQIVRKFQAAW